MMATRLFSAKLLMNKASDVAKMKEHILILPGMNEIVTTAVLSNHLYSNEWKYILRMWNDQTSTPLKDTLNASLVLAPHALK